MIDGRLSIDSLLKTKTAHTKRSHRTNLASAYVDNTARRSSLMGLQANKKLIETRNQFEMLHDWNN